MATPSSTQAIGIPELIRAFRDRKPLLADNRGLTKRQLNEMKRAWTTLVRARLQNLRIPDHASYRDVVAVFDAILAEVATGREIIMGIERVTSGAQDSEAEAWLRRQLEGLGK